MKCLWLLNIGTIELEGAWDLLMVYNNWDHELGGACEMLWVNNNWNPELRGTNPSYIIFSIQIFLKSMSKYLQWNEN